MVTRSTTDGSEHFFAGDTKCGRWWRLPFAGLILLLLAGCRTSKPTFTDIRPTNSVATATNSVAPEMNGLREGDVIRVTFPGAPNINPPSQQIRQDGNITLPLIGEVKAAGKTPAELEKELSHSYASQIVNPTVTVTVESSSFRVYVTGAVLHQGPVTSSHSLTALEAIMEAGGPDYNKANLKKVKLTRKTGTGTENFVLDLKSVMDGTSKESFYLKPSDIIFVPEKFKIFE